MCRSGALWWFVRCWDLPSDWDVDDGGGDGDDDDDCCYRRRLQRFVHPLGLTSRQRLHYSSLWLLSAGRPEERMTLLWVVEVVVVVVVVVLVFAKLFQETEAALVAVASTYGRLRC